MSYAIKSQTFMVFHNNWIVGEIIFEIFIIILVVFGLGVLVFMCKPNERGHGSRDYLRTNRTAEKAEQQIDFDRDYAREKERRRDGGSRSRSISVTIL